uniref:GED domain-containing protein n=1 Tax=Gongylonema pulchrum TaxID=637853 RepID=A0A183E9H3_9BILA
LESINPLDNLTQLDILTAIRNATGPRPALFVPEVSFELLVKKQIRRLEEPSLRCVELVHEELQRIVQHCGIHTQEQILIEDESKHAAQKRTAAQVDASTSQEMQLESNSTQATASTSAVAVDTASSIVNVADGTARIAGWLFGAGSKDKDDVQHSPATRKAINLLPEVPEKTITRKLTPREQRDCQIIERLIGRYFMIVRKNIQDTVPKAIMHFLVNYVRDNLQSELVRQLYKHEIIEELLAESPVMAQRRKETADMLEVYF